MANSVSHGTIVVDTRELKALAKDLKASSPELTKRLRTGMRAAGQIVADEAKSRSAYSRQIPGSIGVSVLGFGATVKVTAKAPNAAPIENEGKGFVRHPVFGDMDVWTAKNSHPAFLGPALDAKADDVAEAISNVVDATLDEFGLD